MSQVLVASESKYGSSAEIAGKIVEILEAEGHKVILSEAGKVKDLSGYDAIVLGSAIYYGRWRTGAVKFLKRHKDQLAKMPVWFFSSGPIGEGDPVELLDGWQFPPLQQEIADRIKPQGIAVFHGKLDESKLSRLEKMIMETMETPFGDFRDWEMIESWVYEIAKSLKNYRRKEFEN